VLFLDEPTTGLDVMSAKALRETMLSLKSRGTSILLTTHYIEEADRLCDRVAIVVKGKIAAIGTPTALKESIGAEKAVDIKVAPRGLPIEDQLRRFTAADKIERRGEFFRCHVHDMNAFLSEFLALSKANTLKIEEIHTVTPSLEDAFVEITGLRREAMIEEKAGEAK
jgi:ABC-2 type transport system ATP-binding protein